MYKKFLLSMCSAAVLTSVALPSAQAQAPSSQNAASPNTCIQAANFPKPHGEWDLKGNAKLPAYCECYMTKFRARAEKRVMEMQTNPAAPKKTLQQSMAEELAMRNSCRKDLGLPLAVDPNK